MKVLRALTVVLVLLSTILGCSVEDPAGAGVAGDVALTPDEGAIVPDVGAGGETVSVDSATTPRVDTEEPSDCMPGSGCFGEPCDSNADCLTELCLPHLGDNVCSKPCVENCPSGWSCKSLSIGSSDLT